MTQRFARRSAPENFTDVGIPPLGEFKQQGIINFTHGYASPLHLPRDKLTEAATRVFSEDGDIALQYGPAKGTRQLRETLVEYLPDTFGIETSLENVAIITGSKQGTDMMCKGFVEPDDKIVITAPTYGTGLKIMKTYEPEFVTVPVDEHGMVTEVLRAKLERMDRDGETLPKFVFDVPEFHNPIGVTMPIERRKQLLELAETYDMKIIEDAPYRELRFGGERVPPIKSFDESGSVVFLGTYSKLICPGIRVGWMVADEEIIDRLMPLKEDGGTSPLTQLLLNDLHNSGYVEERTRTYTNFLEGQRDATVTAIEKHLPDAVIRHVPQGGYYMWIEMPDSTDTTELLEYARREGVLYLPGESFAPTDEFKHCLRVSWAYETADQIKEGIQRLERAWEKYQRETSPKEQIREG